MKKLWTVLAGAAILAAPAIATVTGKVVDGNGAPVADAMVYYTSIANRMVYVYSHTDGAFCIPAPTDWSVNDPPMYKSCGTRIQRSPQSQTFSSSFFAQQKGSNLVFYVAKANSKITADVFSLSGKLVSRVLDKIVTAGGCTYSFNPFGGSKGIVSQQTYVVRLSDGTKTQSVRMINVGMDQAANASLQPGIGSAPRLAKVTAMDGLRVGKTGYKPNTVNLATHSDNVGNVAITVIDIEGKVDSILKGMTLDEKVGQTVQCSNVGNISGNFAGSFLKGNAYADQQADQNAAMSSGAKIPVTVGTDYVHGGPIVYYPHNVGLGTGADTLLIELAYRQCAMCCKVGNNMNFAPVMDIPRNDKNGRVYEGWGENVDATAHFARAAVRGVQGTDISSDYTMIATCKHFAGAGGTQDGQMHVCANTATWAQLCRIHLPQFHAAVDAGAQAIMTSYNLFPTSQSKDSCTAMTMHKVLITDTLKTAWKFDGFVISDWDMGTDASVGGTAQGPINAVRAGLDVGMEPDFTTQFLSAVKGATSDTAFLSRVNDAARRCIRVKLRMGLFANPMPSAQLQNYFADPVYRSVARACARKAIVLLKNDGATLPLKKTAKIHVVGAWADNLGVQCGGWTETNPSDASSAWQGTTVPHGIAGATTILQGLQAGIASTGRITYSTDATGIQSDASIVVVVVGETPYAEDQGYRADITLAADQIALVHACAASGRPVVTILLTGRPNALSTIPTDSKALVAAWLPGTEGEGVTDVLYGDYNFVGKLPYTWPASKDQEPINEGNMGDQNTAGTPLYAYGYGLTYK